MAGHDIAGGGGAPVMMDQAQLLTLLHDNGVAILAPLAVLEGPVVTILAGWLASIGVIGLYKAYMVVVLADLVGDSGFYLLGRFAPNAVPGRLRARLGLSPRGLVRMRSNFRTQGPRILLIGKITHAAGFAVLIAAGMARMRFGTFLLFNLLGTLPKSAAFLALGYVVGSATARIENWLTAVSVIVLALAALWALRHWFAGREVAP